MHSARLWRPDSLWRRPERRWLRAGHLAETGHRIDRRIDDEWVAVARDALLGRGGKRSKAAVVRAGHDLWAGDAVPRGHLEARLLTDESFAAIATRFGLPVTVVEAFEACFFAVRGERERRATDWVARMAVGYSPFAGFTHPLPMAAWMLAAWTGGSLLLDVIHAVTTGGPLPTGLVTGPDSAGRERLVRLRGEVWLAMMSARTDDEFARAVRLRRHLRAQEGQLHGRVPPVSAVEDAMERLWTGLPVRHRATDTGAGWDESIPVVRAGLGDGRWMANDGPDTAPFVDGFVDDPLCESVADAEVVRPPGTGRDRRAG